MSSTDQQYPEVSGDDSGIVPPQSAPKAEWPKKIRTLTAVELDRLTIDADGRFYWDGKLVNYQPGQAEFRPQDSFDRVAMQVLGETASEFPDRRRPAEPLREGEPAPALEGGPAGDDARPVDQFTPIVPVAEAAVRPSAAMASIGTYPVTADRVRIKLTFWQSLGVILLLLGILVGTAGLAAQAFVAAHDWSCRTGWATQSCPKPPPAPAPPPRPDVAT
jgi:hypothetical protein